MADEILLIGSGGREHALAWKLAQSPLVKHVHVCPGNAGTQNGNKISNIALNVKNHSEIIDWCKSHSIKLVVVGPEDPLANGISDALQKAGIKCFGPSQKASNIEASKLFAKEFMDRHDIPTANWLRISSMKDAENSIMNAPFDGLVVKASGLAAGKGVIVCSSREEAVKTVEFMKSDKALSSASETIVVEERLEGEEVSVLCFTDGKSISVMPPSQDHKRLEDGDKGPNTGGMGAYCRCLQVSNETLDEIKSNILQKAVNGLRAEGTPFVGVLYAGLMLTKSGPKVLEFNCRFGDPETQVILPLLKSDLYEIMLSCVNGTLEHLKNVEWHNDRCAVGVVVVSGGYPGSYPKGKAITGLDSLEKEGFLVFHAGTALKADELVTSGGRVLAVVSLEQSLFAAANKATSAAGRVSFEGAFYRKDIAHKGIRRLSHKGVTYESCGVDIEKADSLVSKLKPLAQSTSRPGTASGIGGFGGVFDLKAAGYSDPYLVSGTDGVGTKLKVAQACNKHDTVGIDLVAMCVNDILTQGAEPLFFLDYFACGKLNIDLALNVLNGIAEGCRQAKCVLLGGETAEMPGMYQGDEYELAGFATGAVEKSLFLPKVQDISEGDVVIGLPSSGIHSNGFSLVRKLVEGKGFSYSQPAPFDHTVTLGEALLVPTKIYVQSLLPVIKAHMVKAAAHITGGGLSENIPRVLPKHLGVILDASKWVMPPVLKWIAGEGNLEQKEMLKTFNCGLGMVLIVSQKNAAAVLDMVKAAGETGLVVGHVTQISEGEQQVEVTNFSLPISLSQKPKCKVGVLISGSGTNLQALIDHTQNPSNFSAAEIVLVLSNVPNVEGLKRAERAGIPTKVLSHKGFSSRVDFDMAVHQILKEAGVEIVCLAGFMRILSEQFVKLWQGHLLNVHPSLLPSFKGMDAHKQVLEMGARVTGCTVHFVEPEVDAGAIIEQAALKVNRGETVESLQARVKELEHQIFPRALELLARGEISRGADGKIVWKS